MKIYYKVEKNGIELNPMFITDEENSLIYGGRIFRKNRYSKENLTKGVNYICKTHRENEAIRKNKRKLCYARIEKKKIFINNSEEIKYYFKINHSNYCDEEYIRESISKVQFPKFNFFY